MPTNGNIKIYRRQYERGAQERQEMVGTGEGTECVAEHILMNELAFSEKYRAILTAIVHSLNKKIYFIYIYIIYTYI